MISQNMINELYITISKDLSITKFSNETEKSFRSRLVYSALGNWILTLFSDRDFEDNDNGAVSKSHVTIMAMDILAAYKKIDPSLFDYFTDDEKLVGIIENTYLQLGYVKNGSYIFKIQNRNCCLTMANKTLDIDTDSNFKDTKGLGTWRKPSSSDITLDNFLLVKETADIYTRKLISQLKYSEFNPNFGKNEIYNTYKNKWEYYSDKLAGRNEISIIKVDDGLDYQIIKFVDGVAYAASLPIIYTKQSADKMFTRDVWRIILGLCSINGYKAKCNLRNIDNEFILLSFNGFILPYLEDALLRCMCWPLGNCCNLTEFITDASMKHSIVELLTTLSIEINEE